MKPGCGCGCNIKNNKNSKNTKKSLSRNKKPIQKFGNHKTLSKKSKSIRIPPKPISVSSDVSNSDSNNVSNISDTSNVSNNVFNISDIPIIVPTVDTSIIDTNNEPIDIPVTIPINRKSVPNVSKPSSINNSNNALNNVYATAQTYKNHNEKFKNYKTLDSKILKSWSYIHEKANNAKTISEKQEFETYIEYLSYYFPCPKCRPHIGDYLRNNPIQNYYDQEMGIGKWSWEFHNAVNTRLGKQLMSWEDYLSVYKY